MNWEPITIQELQNEITKSLNDLNDETLAFWKSIKIAPEKWIENEFGNEGGGFWVVAIYKNYVIWYNDIEEGFNISEFNHKGHIQEYNAEQDELKFSIIKLKNLTK